LTVAWNEGAEPAVPRSEAQIKEREASGEVRVLKGTPDTDPMSFVVNCPSPVLAPNDYDPATFESMAAPEA
jgi:hypothetical protein